MTFYASNLIFGVYLEKLKCGICNNNDNVAVLGIDVDSKKRVFECTCIDMMTDRPYRFDDSGGLLPKRLNVIKCPICKQSKYVVFNGNFGHSFICKNRSNHEDEKIHIFVFVKDTLVTLKEYLNRIDPDIYDYLYKLYIRRKRLKKATLIKKDVEDVQSCLELGLNQTLISAIFHVHQSSISRIIKKEKIVYEKQMMKVVKQIGDIGDRVFNTKMKIHWSSVPAFEVEV